MEREGGRKEGRHERRENVIGREGEKKENQHSQNNRIIQECKYSHIQYMI